MKTYLRIVTFLLTLIVALSGAAAVKKPNVLLICVDDLNTQMGGYGNPVVKTPHFDRLAKMGVRFDRAYCNYPVCNPSRTSMLSGRYPEQTQVLSNNAAPRSKVPDLKFLPELFKEHGYYTAGIGKIFHGTFMDTIKWDEWINPKDAESEEAAIRSPESFPAGGGDRKEERQKRRQAERSAGPREARADKGEARDVPFSWRATDNKDEEEPDGQIATRAIEVLEEHQKGPLFLAVGFHKPHIGHVAPKKYFDLYSLDQIKLPQEPPLAEQGIPDVAYTAKRHPNLTDDQKRQIILHYYAATTFMDTQLGRVMAAMDRLKLWDNTIVVFWGDHGWHHGEHGGMWAKASLLEESARLPLAIVAPGKKKGAICKRVVESVDLFPTLAEYCGLPQPKGLAGRSLLPLLDDPRGKGQDAAYTVVMHRGGIGRSLRTEDWTYIEWANGEVHLYDPRKDPKEYRNLAKEPGFADEVLAMKAALKKAQPK